MWCPDSGDFSVRGWDRGLGRWRLSNLFFNGEFSVHRALFETGDFVAMNVGTAVNVHGGDDLVAAPTPTRDAVTVDFLEPTGEGNQI